MEINQVFLYLSSKFLELLRGSSVRQDVLLAVGFGNPQQECVFVEMPVFDPYSKENPASQY